MKSQTLDHLALTLPILMHVWTYYCKYGVPFHAHVPTPPSTANLQLSHDSDETDLTPRPLKHTE